MATKKTSKSTKQLRKAKKLETTKPLSNCCQGAHIKQATIQM